MNRDHFRPHQAHAENVRRLAFDILRAHVDAALQAEQGAGEGRGHAVLAGAGFGDNFRFAHPFRQQSLAEHLVSFMRAAVQQVFTFQIQRRAGAFSEVAAFGQRRRTTGVVFQQVGKFGLECRIFLRADERVFQLAQGGHQDLRNVHSAEFAKVGVQ